MNSNQENSLDNSKLRYLYQAVQMLLFVGAVITISCVGMGHMTTQGIINVALDLMSMFVLAIIYSNCYHGRELNNTRELRALVFVLYLCVFFEVGIWLFDTLAPYRILNYISNIGCNSTILIATYLYFLFVKKSRGIDANVYPWLRGFMRTVMISGITAEVMNCIGGYFYVIDAAGVYVRGSYGSLLGYIPFLLILGGVALFIIRQKMDWQTKFRYMSYGIMPFVTSLWYTFTGFPPTFFVATAMSMLLIHGNIYVAQSKEAEFLELENAKSEAEFALSRNMLMLSQIRPHFMYNALGSIEVLCKLDPEKAGRAIHHFTHYLRSNMDIVKSEDTIPFSQELEHIRNYVWLEQMRFDDELEYKEEIEATDFRVPQLAIQPMVENAIKHGMMGNEDGLLHVTLKTQETETEYIVTVNDDGCGFDTTKAPEDGRSHIGIQGAAYNLQLRVGGTLHIDSQPGKGTTVTIRIPKGGTNE